MQESEPRGIVPILLAAVCGLAVGVAVGLVVASIGGKSLAEVAAENAALVKENEGLRAAKTTNKQEPNVGERAIEATLRVAKAQRKFRTAAWFADVEEAEKFDKQIEEMSVKVGIPQSELYLTAANAMSQRFMLPYEDVLEITEVVADIFPDDAEERDSVAKTVLGIRRATKMSVRAAAAWLLASEGKCGIKARWISKILNACPGADPKEMMAAGMTIAASTGEDPSDGVIAMVQGLRKLMPEDKTE